MSPMFFLKQTPGRVGDLVAKRILASPGACSRNFLLRSSPPPRRLASQKEATAECLARQCLPQCLFARGGRGSLKRKPANNELAQPYVTSWVSEFSGCREVFFLAPELAVEAFVMDSADDSFHL